MLPRGHGDHEFFSVVDAVEEIDLHGLAFFKLTLGIGVAAEEQIVTNPVYASKPVCGEYRPRVGDAVKGVLWLQGRIAREQ